MAQLQAVVELAIGQVEDLVCCADDGAGRSSLGSPATGELRPFMGGAFFAAIRAQVPVIPVAIVGTYELLPINSFHMLPGEVSLVIGEPIPTTGMRVRDMDKLSAQVRGVIAELYDLHATRVLQANFGEDEPKPLASR